MITMLRGVLIAYVVTWAVLLIACLRKRQFCPIFSDSRKTRLFWLVTFLFVNPILTILYFFFGQIRSAQARPVRAVRDIVVVLAILGFFINIPGLTHLWMQPFMGRSADGPDARLAAIESKTSTNTTTSSVGRENCRLACRHIAVMVDGDHPLLDRIGSNLVEQLGTIPAVEAVELCDSSAFPPSGGRAPDIFVRLHLGSIREIPIPYSLRLKAQVGAEVGPLPWHRIHSHYDRRMPPVFEFNLRLQVMHTSTTTGYESVRYSLAARNIAKDLGEQISKALGQWREKYGLLPELPGEFYGAYHAATELPEPLQKLEPELLGSYTGLLKHNETYRQFIVADEPVKAIEQLRDAMIASGWEELSSDWRTPSIELRLGKDNRRIDVFQVRRREPFNGTTVIVRSSGEKPAHLFGVTDVQLFSDEELKVVLDLLLAGTPVPERLMFFEGMFDEQQEERLLQALETQPPSDVSVQIKLGWMYLQRDQSGKALQALTRAKTLLWAVQDDSTYKSRLKSLAKKLGDEKLAGAAPTVEDFRDAGFIELPASGETFDVEADLDRPVVMFAEGNDSGPFTLSVTVVSSGSDQDPFSVKYVLRRLHGSSSGSRGGSRLPTGGPWHCDLDHRFNDILMDCQITQIGSEERFKISVTISE